MNRAELITEIAHSASLTRTQADNAITAFTQSIGKSLKKGESVTLVGFGTFSISERSARAGRNPSSGEIIKIKAKKIAKFKAGKGLSEIAAKAKIAK